MKRELRLECSKGERGGHHSECAVPRDECGTAQARTAADEQQPDGQRAEEDDVRSPVGPSSQDAECGGITGAGTEKSESTERQ